MLEIDIDVRRLVPLTREEALENAWMLAQDEFEILAVEDPDDEPVSMDEIEAWFERRSGEAES